MNHAARLLLVFAGATALGAAPPLPHGYLEGTLDITGIVPPPPGRGDIRYETDRKVFRSMKALVGSARWDYATRDVPSNRADVMRDFSCAAGITLDPELQPSTYRVLAIAGSDTSRANNAAKDHWKRLRPFLIDRGQTCEAPDAVAPNEPGAPAVPPQHPLRESYDYPSGHTTRGWTYGMILAALLPNRAEPILERARSYGESRIVCRVHNMSAVEAGRLGATVTMQAIERSAAFQADLAAARAELSHTQLRPDASACAREKEVVWPSVLANLR